MPTIRSMVRSKRKKLFTAGIILCVLPILIHLLDKSCYYPVVNIFYEIQPIGEVQQHETKWQQMRRWNEMIAEDQANSLGNERVSSYDKQRQNRITPEDITEIPSVLKDQDQQQNLSTNNQSSVNVALGVQQKTTKHNGEAKVKPSIPKRSENHTLIHEEGDPHTNHSYYQRHLPALISPEDPRCVGYDKEFFLNKVNNKDGLVLLVLNALQDYIAWHVQMRIKLRKGSFSKVRVLIWYFPNREVSFGLGDRIRGINLALFLAIMSERFLLVQWSNSSLIKNRQQIIFKPNLINWAMDHSMLRSFENVTQSRIQSWSSVDRLRTTFASNIKAIDQIVSKNDSLQHVQIITNSYIRKLIKFYGNLSSNTRKTFVSKGFTATVMSLLDQYYDDISGLLVRALYKFTPKIHEMGNQLLTQLGIGDRTLYSTLHIRTGFYGTLNEDPSRFTELTKQKTWKHLVEVAIQRTDSLIGPDAPILLLTDSDKVKAWASAKFQHRVKVVPGSSHHIGIQEKYDKANSSELLEAQYQLGTELILLAHSKLLIYSAGGFSRIGAYICGISKVYEPIGHE